TGECGHDVDIAWRCHHSNGGVSVTIDGQTAPITYAGASQLNIPVPYEVTTGNNKQVSVTNGTNPPATTTVTIAATAPGFPLLTGRERGKLPLSTSAPPRRLTASTTARRRLTLAIRFCST
ncbi:MAG TPA: hypothetical protein VEV37_05930, partial [Bryobacteraceae bacterium]|nr:hypothetical protein [Bryobacteraceae bacterium]